MIIVINADLEPNDLTRTINARSKKSISDAVRYESAKLIKQDSRNLKTVTDIGDYDFYSNMGMLHNLSAAYSLHYGIVINPHDLWYLILTQIAEAVNKNPGEFKKFFTDTEEKQLIAVPQNHDTDINVAAILEQLKGRMPGGEKFAFLFMPELSTHTNKSRLACAAAFASTVKEYYDYGMYCCGITHIDLRGTADDYLSMRDNIGLLSDKFKDTSLCNYLKRIYDILDRINLAFVWESPFAEKSYFWEDIYTQKNVGSGGDLVVDGWIKEFYLNNEPNKMIKSFHTSLSVFEYCHLNTGQKYVMAHGALGTKINTSEHGQSFETVYDHLTFEIIDEPKTQTPEITMRKISVDSNSRKLADGWTFIDIVNQGIGLKRDDENE